MKWRSKKESINMKKKIKKQRQFKRTALKSENHLKIFLRKTVV